MENIRKEKRAVSILLIFLMVMSLLMPLASGIANAASTITVTYGGGVYSYNSSGGKPAENIHGKFSTSDGGIEMCIRDRLYRFYNDRLWLLQRYRRYHQIYGRNHGA